MSGRWVHSWSSAPQRAEPADLPPAPFTRDGLVLAGGTLRQTIRVSIGGTRLRLRLSNAFGPGTVGPGTVGPGTVGPGGFSTGLTVAAVAVALPAGGRAGVDAIQPGTSREVTFAGRTSVCVPAGAEGVSDPLDLPVAPGTNLTVTFRLAGGAPATGVTAHPGSRTTSYLIGGDHVRDANLPGAVPVEHWYFLSGLEVWSGPGAAAAVMLGDSLTDGRGSTTDGNDRWPDQLSDRLRAREDTRDVAILNQGIGGNRVLRDGLGPRALSRIERDVLTRGGVAWLLVFEGVNDIGTAEATDAAQKRVARELIDAYDQIIGSAHAAGVRVYGATITPFGGNPDYDDPAGTRGAARRAVNDWIRESGRFDAVVDFDRAVRDPADPGRLAAAFDTGDHLHLNSTGYRALAGAVPAWLFTHRAVPAGSA